ncbi:MAG: hypothetical protein IKQ72_05730 [Bacteroidaceae bacterium]|nr:hypothetical protein [Bacteroidaceae bacterium]
MKLHGLSLAAVLLLTGTTHVFAQKASSDDKPMVELTANVKTYYLDRMGYAPNATLADVLGSYSDYDLMVNGVECNETEFLKLTHVSQVERIEYITDNHNGAFIGSKGCLNIILEDAEDGTHGHATLYMDTRANYAPWFNLTNKNDKLTIWANVKGDINKSKNDAFAYAESTYNRYNSLGTNIQESTSNRNAEDKDHAYIADFGLRYKDERNTLTFHIYDRWKRNNSDTYQDKFYYRKEYDNSNSNYSEQYETEYRIGTSENKNNTLFASADFRHILNEKTTLAAILSEEYSKYNDNSMTEGYTLYCSNKALFDIYNSTEKIANLYDKAEIIDGIDHYSAYKTPLDTETKNYKTRLDAFANIKATDNLSLKTGMYFKWQNTDFSESSYESLDMDNLHIMPYALASYKQDKWSFNLGERLIYRYDKSTVEGFGISPFSPEDWKNITKDYSGDKVLSATNASIIYTPGGNHQFMLSYTRDADYNTSIERGTTLIYSKPQCTFKETKETKKLLNFDYTFSGPKISASLNASYRKYTYEQNATIEIVNGLTGTTSSPEASDYEFDTKYYTVGAKAFGTFGILNIMANAEYYKIDSELSKNNYWYITIKPIVNLPYNIKASATASYSRQCTNVETEYSKEDYDPRETWSCNFLLSKQWKNFEIYANWQNAIHNNRVVSYTHTTKPDSYSGGSTSKSHTTTDYHNSQVLVGVSYRF